MSSERRITRHGGRVYSLTAGGRAALDVISRASGPPILGNATRWGTAVTCHEVARHVAVELAGLGLATLTARHAHPTPLGQQVNDVIRGRRPVEAS